MVNKTSSGGRGGGKKLKKVSIFFQIRGFKGGHNVAKAGWGTPSPLNKSPRTSLQNITSYDLK